MSAHPRAIMNGFRSPLSVVSLSSVVVVLLLQPMFAPLLPVLGAQLLDPCTTDAPCPNPSHCSPTRQRCGDVRALCTGQTGECYSGLVCYQGECLLPVGWTTCSDPRNPDDDCLNPSHCSPAGECGGEGAICDHPNEIECASGLTCISGRCQNPCNVAGAPNCGIHGSCVNSQGIATCSCRDGYSGPLCNNFQDPSHLCTDVNCGTHGSCDVGTGACICTDQYYGDTCQSPPPTTGSEAWYRHIEIIVPGAIGVLVGLVALTILAWWMSRYCCADSEVSLDDQAFPDAIHLRSVYELSQTAKELSSAIFPPLGEIFGFIQQMAELAETAHTNAHLCRDLSARVRALRPILLKLADHWLVIEAHKSPQSDKQVHAALPTFQTARDVFKDAMELMSCFAHASRCHSFCNAKEWQRALLTQNTQLTQCVTDLHFGLTTDFAVSTRHMITELQEQSSAWAKLLEPLAQQLNPNQSGVAETSPNTPR